MYNNFRCLKSQLKEEKDMQVFLSGDHMALRKAWSYDQVENFSLSLPLPRIYPSTLLAVS